MIMSITGISVRLGNRPQHYTDLQQFFPPAAAEYFFSLLFSGNHEAANIICRLNNTVSIPIAISIKNVENPVTEISFNLQEAANRLCRFHFPRVYHQRHPDYSPPRPDRADIDNDAVNRERVRPKVFHNLPLSAFGGTLSFAHKDCIPPVSVQSGHFRFPAERQPKNCCKSV